MSWEAEKKKECKVVQEEAEEKTVKMDKKGHCLALCIQKGLCDPQSDRMITFVRTQVKSGNKKNSKKCKHLCNLGMKYP